MVFSSVSLGKQSSKWLILLQAETCTYVLCGTQECSASSPFPLQPLICVISVQKNQLENFWLRNTRRWLKSQYLTNRQPDALHLLLHKYCYQVSLAKVLIKETKTHVCEAVCPHSDSRPACPNPGHCQLRA